MLIPEHKIEEVLDRVDLVALISRHMELKKTGRSWKGRCPFHQEKTPSFQVTPEMRRFKCFGCGAGGDAIAFVQRYLGKTFVDSVRDLAREVGVDLEAAVDPAARERQQLKEVTDLAAEHFKTQLWHPEVGAGARSYLLGRGVSEDMARAFGLGWAPLAWTAFAELAARQGMLEWAEKAGLVARRPKVDGHYDLFRGRLIVPIRAPEGRPIAFGGRLLEGDSGPKYLNSRESRLYNKSETLFGLDVAREEIRRFKAAVLVEGYFDCMGLHHAGIRHAVALCSTALTPGHLKLLARAEARDLFLLLDGDEAGRKAVERLAGPLLAAGASTRVGLLPDGEDPDTFARRVGPQGVQALLSAARPLSEHLFDTVLPRGEAAAFEDKMRALERLKPTLAQVPVGLVRSALFSGLSRHFGLPAVELEAALRGRAEVPRSVPKPGGAERGAERGAEPDRPVTPRGGSSGVRAGAAGHERPVDPLEATLTAVALRQPELLREDPSHPTHEVSHPGLRAVLAHLSSGGTPEDALYDAPERVKAAIELAQRNLPPSSPDLAGAFGALTKKLRIRRIDEQLSHISRAAQGLGDPSGWGEDIQRLQEERIELLSLRKRVLEGAMGGTSGTKPPPQLV